MSGNYQSNEYVKNARSRNMSKRPKRMVLAKEISQQRKDRLKSWVTFYRHNISFFVEHYMGVKLYPYQRFWITLMGHSTNFLAVASRASAKSWLIAVYSIAKCILYPGTTVALCSSTKEQAGLIISQWCVALRSQHPNILRESPVNPVVNQNKWEMTFLNGSKINVVISGESGRGHRSTIDVLEERRLIPTEIIDSIIRPFLVSRQPPYLQKPEYAHLKEEPQEIIITSAYYKSYEWWLEAKKIIRMVASNDPDVKCIFLDFMISLKHGIKTKKQMLKEKDLLDPITFLMEYGNIPYSSSSQSFFKIGLFDRKVKRGWRPIKEDIDIKKNEYDIGRLEDEIRVIGVDVAMRKGAMNDNTIISCGRLMPSKRGWLTEISYLESQNGKNALLQALRIKQIFKEFNADYLILDIKNAGLPLYDALTSITKDDMRGIEYPAMMVMRDTSIEESLYDDLKQRTLNPDGAKECIFPISATAELNSMIAVTFKDRLKKKLVSFLCDDWLEEDFLIKSKDKHILDQEDLTWKPYLLQSHVQTTLLINECISLEMSMVGNGLVKLQEAPGARKDRYTSVSYLNYFVSLRDQELLRKYDDHDDLDIMLSLIQHV